MRLNTLKRTTTTLLLLVFSVPALAVPLNVSYTLGSGDELTFTIDGTVQADMDTIVVDALIGTPLFNGTAALLGGTSGFLSFTDVDAGLLPGDPVISPALLSFSGAIMDFIFFNNFNTDGFLFFADGTNSIYSSGPSYGSVGEIFAGDRWSVTPATPIPEPAGLALVGVGMIAFGLTRRGQRAK